MIRSIIIWITTGLLIPIWFLIMLIVRIFDADPVHYYTGYFFRKLGNILVLINPAWKLEIMGEEITNPRLPYVVVCNHQSMVDIPLISNLPWEMKWMAKKELFKIPIIGWMMKLAGDICVDRKNPRSGAKAFLQALDILKQQCSIMIFPEGTRTIDGRVSSFTDGAFYLAIKAKVNILPLVIDGSRNCIPKNSWKFGSPSKIFLKVLPPIETAQLTINDIVQLKENVRKAIIKQIAEWRSVSIDEVDGLFASSSLSKLIR